MTKRGQKGKKRRKARPEQGLELGIQNKGIKTTKTSDNKFT